MITLRGDCEMVGFSSFSDRLLSFSILPWYPQWDGWPWGSQREARVTVLHSSSLYCSAWLTCLNAVRGMPKNRWQIMANKRLLGGSPWLSLVWVGWIAMMFGTELCKGTAYPNHPKHWIQPHVFSALLPLWLRVTAPIHQNFMPTSTYENTMCHGWNMGCFPAKGYGMIIIPPFT